MIVRLCGLVSSQTGHNAAQALEACSVIRIAECIAETVDGCEHGVRIAGQFCAGPIHRYLDSNLRF